MGSSMKALFFVEAEPFGRAACLVLAACGGSAEQPSGDCSYSGAPTATTTSDTGVLGIEVRSCPDPPSRGTNSVELSITRSADGTPVDGLVVEVTPFMPAMGHGTSTPTIVAEGGGKYLVSEVYLYMPGVWLLRTAVSGPVSDNAAPSLSVP
jgi:hypothetical protein